MGLGITDTQGMLSSGALGSRSAPKSHFSGVSLHPALGADGFKGIYPSLIPVFSQKEALEGFQSPKRRKCPPRKFQMGISTSPAATAPTQRHRDSSCSGSSHKFLLPPIPGEPRAGKAWDKIRSHPNPWEAQPGFSPSQPRRGCLIPTQNQFGE